MPIPFFTRLGFKDYVRLLLTFTVFLLEKVLRLSLSCFPIPIERILARCLPNISFSTKNLKTRSVVQLIHSQGFQCEEHFVTTSDGFVLALHRIAEKNRPHIELDHLPNGIKNSPPVVLLWHGFMMNSEVWVCHPDTDNSLAFFLANQGYDVWLGNCRGNKYSSKHLNLKLSDPELWDHSLDQYALIDLPESIDYILNATHVSSLSYIGFSQGTAIGFAAFSMNDSLSKKVNLFIALAPATKPKDLHNEEVSVLAKSSTDLIFLLLGRKSALSSLMYWQDLFSPRSWVYMIDRAVHYLFNWHGKNISQKYKQILYRHLYSTCSVKTIVHWFQIIRNGRFQMYDDKSENTFLPYSTQESFSPGIVVPCYPTSRIRIPIAIFYGGEDTLSDVQYLLENLHSTIIQLCQCVEKYEHLDFLWADDMGKQIFQPIIHLLQQAPKAVKNITQTNIHPQLEKSLCKQGEDTNSLSSTEISSTEDNVGNLKPKDKRWFDSIATSLRIPQSKSNEKLVELAKTVKN